MDYSNTDRNLRNINKNFKLWRFKRKFSIKKISWKISRDDEVKNLELKEYKIINFLNNWKFIYF